MASKNRPAFQTVLRTYADLDAHAAAFAEGHLNLLILIGRPGVGKSRALRDRVDGQACWITGTASAFGLYVEAYRSRNRPIVLDDIDGLSRDRQGVRLLKALCQTDPEKTVCWHTHSTALERQVIPHEFKTNSHVAILANTWSRGEDVEALQDRGHLVAFDPPPFDVHQKAAEWFWDTEIFDFVAENLHLLPLHSFRAYIAAWECKQAGLPWRSSILERSLSGPALEVAKLRWDSRYQTEEERAQAFIKAGFGCRATYFNHARKVRPPIEIPRLELRTTTPPTAPKPPESWIEIIRRRHKGLGHG